MRTFILGPRELDKYAELWAITDVIQKAYTNLYELEIKDQKDSPEYQELFKSLNRHLDKEQGIYADERLTSDLCQAFINLIMQTKLRHNLASNIEAIVSLDDDTMNSRRILTKLSNKLMNDNVAMLQMMPNGLKEVLSSLGVEDIEKVMKGGINTSVKFHQSLEKDVLTIFLSCVEECKASFGRLNNNFVGTKYVTSFITPQVETDMIESQFTVSPLVYVSSRFVADVLKIVDEAFISIKNIYGIELANEQLEGLLKITDFDHADQDRNCEAILRQCLLRAVLFLVSDDVAQTLKTDFDSHPKDSVISPKKISVSIIEEAFAKIEKDKAKHRVYSLNPNVVF